MSALADVVLSILDSFSDVLARIDSGYQYLIYSFFFLVAAFHLIIFTPLYPSTKQRAWILTAIASATMTSASLPFVAHFVLNRGDVISLPQMYWLSDATSRFFQAYLAADLAVGTFWYRDRINIATGWGHHIVYFILVDFFVRWKWSHIFMLAALMELPTFNLAISSLHPQFRNDAVFAALFFSTRIALHLGLMFIYLLNSTRYAAPEINGSLFPATLFLLAFPMHAVWFMGCIKGFIKRADTRKTAVVGGSAATLPMSTAASVSVAASSKFAVPEDTESEIDATERYQTLLSAEIIVEEELAVESALAGPGSSSYPTTPTSESPSNSGQWTPRKKNRLDKLYPPTEVSLPSTPVRASPPRAIITTSSRSRSGSAASSLSSVDYDIHPTSPSKQYNPLVNSISQLYIPGSLPAPSSPYSPIAITPFSIAARRPLLANVGPRRRSFEKFLSTEREESLKRLAANIAEAVYAASPTVQSAVEVGRDVVGRYRAFRGRRRNGNMGDRVVRASALERRAAWGGVDAGTAVEAY